MTERANNVLQKMKQREALKRLKLFNNPERRDRILREFNDSTLDKAGPVGGDRSDALLREMNDLQSDHNEFVKSPAPKIGVS